MNLKTDKEDKTDYLQSALNEYQATVFKWGIMLLVGAAQCAAVTYTVLALLGLFPTVDIWKLVTLDVIDFIFLCVGIWLANTATENGVLLPDKQRFGKIFIVAVPVIQWNLILYIIPSHAFWGFIFFFVCLAAFALDLKLLIISSVLHFISLIIAWLITDNFHLAITPELYLTDITQRIICMLLSLVDLIILVYFVRKYLVSSLSYDTEHDALTGVGNRASFDKLKKRLAVSHRALAIAVIDVDNFKGINDTYGHDMGDMILTKVAKTLKKHIRPSDVVIRLGGDEFVAVFMDFQNADPDIIVQKFKAINEELNAPAGDVPAVSISVGVALDDSGYSELLLKHADEALYRIKQSGKNGCSIY